jgi:hypothetical protein
MKNTLILESPEEMSQWEQQWEAFRKEVGGTEFQSFYYNFFSWDCFQQGDKKKLHVFIVFTNTKRNQIASILPFYLDSKDILRFINDKHSDFCDILCKKGRHYDVLKEFGTFIVSNNKIKGIAFENIPSSSPTAGLLKFYLGSRCFVISNVQYSTIFLPQGNEFFSKFDWLKSSRRSELKRIYKKSTPYEFELYNKELKPLPLDEIKRLKAEMVSSGLRNKNFLKDDFLGLIQNLYAKGALLVMEAKKDDKTVALSFCLTWENSTMVWIDLYENIQYINLMNYLKTMEKLSESQNVSFNFGRGIYAYKVKNFQPTISSLLSVEYYKKPAHSFLSMNKYIIKSILKSIRKK